MGKKSEKFLSYIVIILIIVFYGCSGEKSNEVLINFDILDVEDLKMSEFYGMIKGFNEKEIYLGFSRRPLYSINIISGDINQIGEVGEGPAAYMSPQRVVVRDCKKYIYCIRTTRILIFDSENNFIEEKKIGARITIFSFIDDSLIFYLDQTLWKDFFIIYDFKNGRKVNSIGDEIKYPIVRDRDKLYNEGKLKELGTGVGVRDSLLVWYDYYHDELRVYNIYTGDLIQKFGKVHNHWNIPGIFQTPSDNFHESYWIVNRSPCFGVVLSNNYIYVILFKLWKSKWNLRGYEEKDNFVVVDVYDRKDFSYTGSFYPFEGYLTMDDINLIPLNINLQDDTTLEILLHEPCECMYFRKITIVVHPEDSIES